MRRLALILIAAAIAATGASDKKPKPHGAFTPIIAKQRLTYSSEQLNGKERVLSVYEGTYLRASNGSEVALLGPVVNGKVSAPTEGRLRIARDGATYKLDFKTKTATLVATEKTPLTPRTYTPMKEQGGKSKPPKKAPVAKKPVVEAKGKSNAKNKTVKSDIPDSLEENIGDFAGYETINGFKCAGMVLRDHGSQTGVAWREVKHDLMVRLETIFGSNDDHVLVTLERFEVDMKQEPEASFFELPGGWTVIAPTAAEPETKPKPVEQRP